MLGKRLSNSQTAAPKAWKLTATTEALASIESAEILATANTSTLNLNVGPTLAVVRDPPEVPAQLAKAAAASLVKPKVPKKKTAENEYIC